MDLLKQRIGKTILYKTSKLQGVIGKGELYLKMEGVNPTGRMQDRIAYYLVKEAMDIGYNTVTVASLGPLGQSLAYISERYDVDCKVVVPIKSVDKKLRWYKEKNVELIEYGRNYNDAYKKSRELAETNGWYDANHGYSNSSITTAVYSEIAEEIVAKLGRHPQTVICFLSNGALITALHSGFRSLWRRGIIKRIPNIIATCAGDDNPVYQHYAHGADLLTGKGRINRYRGISRNTIEYNILDPQGVVNSIVDSGGTIIPVTVSEVKEMITTVRKNENLKTGFRGAASLVAYKKACEQYLITENNTSVAILEEGTNLVNIKQLSEDDFEKLEQLAVYVERYLGKYGDDHESTMEALKVAFEDGFILGAYMSGELKGLAVVAKMPLKLVMPQYHLIYIGADITTGSRGIGTLLMEEVRNVTDGDFSLHVDIENRKAIKLYEKMGLKKAYTRMLAEH